jgi:hypothetical protein
MRFRNLEGLTDLPIDAVKHRFRYEQVLTVLPVHGAFAGRDSLLVATPTELAIVTADTRRRDRWMTSLAPWDVVRLGEVESEAGTHHLAVDVGNLTFHAELWGPKGEKALRDFVIAARAQHEAIAAPA